ncbi:BspA family leucine-rich repeat surface protein [Flagellimonas myxillae]|uniref:BspA family leucine-rich repeat surface protein n=1 Tax=Flagellimonas myxillae TaxID=2942214 RepID=UPI00201F825A|nr:BspA family leucine-rich repeat surface protein [Muricauda myxillae]MCL6266691.1 BspA family leucine-rich repeat surface protein [Muricauda myxillae]
MSSYGLTVSVYDGQHASSEQITINVNNVNETPSVSNQEFEVKEDVTVNVVLGTLEVSDPENDDLTFGIKTNDADLFEIDSTTGDIRLTQGQNLDFESSEQHLIVVTVADDEFIVELEVRFIVQNVIESPSEDPSAFVTTWYVIDANEVIVVGTDPDDLFIDGYDYTIDWGDGFVEHITNNEPPYHIYAQPGIKTVSINGEFPSIDLPYNSYGSKLHSIEQWGEIQWKDLTFSFAHCMNMHYNATDTPDLSHVTDLTGMFLNAATFNGGDLSGWDVSNITNMSQMFEGATEFNGNIGNWHVNNVTNMEHMFLGAESFNQNLENWVVSKVENMDSMFAQAHKFNGNVTNWNVQSVEDFSAMFLGAFAFNQNLGGWNIKSATAMNGMLSSSGVDIPNYNNTLIGWSQQQDLPTGISLGAFDLVYCGDDAIEARNFLTGAKQWTITNDFECN